MSPQDQASVARWGQAFLLPSPPLWPSFLRPPAQHLWAASVGVQSWQSPLCFPAQ